MRKKRHQNFFSGLKDEYRLKIFGDDIADSDIFGERNIMSYTSLLKMRARILENVQVQQDGLTSNDWRTIDGGDNVRCFLDLNFIRAGKDPVWTPDTLTAENRTGVLFLPPGCAAIPGNRIQMIKGPAGTFEIKSSLDEAWTPQKLHHLECFVQEISRVLAAS